MVTNILAFIISFSLSVRSVYMYLLSVEVLTKFLFGFPQQRITIDDSEVMGYIRLNSVNVFFNPCDRIIKTV